MDVFINRVMWWKTGIQNERRRSWTAFSVRNASFVFSSLSVERSCCSPESQTLIYKLSLAWWSDWIIISFHFIVQSDIMLWREGYSAVCRWMNGGHWWLNICHVQENMFIMSIFLTLATVSRGFWLWHNFLIGSVVFPTGQTVGPATASQRC